jgi:hypothetical protein
VRLIIYFLSAGFAYCALSWHSLGDCDPSPHFWRTLCCSQCPTEFLGEALGFLVRVSEYSYTLRAWRREVFDYVMDPSFFRMTVCHDMPRRVLCNRRWRLCRVSRVAHSLWQNVVMGSWRRLVGNLFTNDKALLQDLMGVFLTARRSAVLVCSKAIISGRRACRATQFCWGVERLEPVHDGAARDGDAGPPAEAHSLRPLLLQEGMHAEDDKVSP